MQIRCLKHAQQCFIGFKTPGDLQSNFSKGLFIWEAGGTFNGISPCMYISLICPVPFIWKEFCKLSRVEIFSCKPGMKNVPPI